MSPRDRIVALVRECGALAAARALAEEYADAAREDLAGLPRIALPGSPRVAAGLHSRARPLKTRGRDESRRRGRASRSPFATSCAATSTSTTCLAPRRSPTGSFDSLERELKDIEGRFPEFVTPDSPTQRVGEKPSDDFASFDHPVPMLSLDNTYSEEDPQGIRATHLPHRRGAIDSIHGGVEDRWGLALPCISAMGRSIVP